MANKRLSITEVEQMKKMVMTGAAPEDIANHFGIAISSVHNYKNRFKSEGMNFPSVRGKRPTGNTPVTQTYTPQPESYPAIGQITGQSSGFKFIVNGVAVQISSEAKSVNIGKDSLEIKF